MLAKDELPLKAAVVKVVDVAAEDGVISGGAPDVSEDVSQPEFDTEDGDSDASGDSEDSDDNWETESLYEDSLEFVRDDQLRDGKEIPLPAPPAPPPRSAQSRGSRHRLIKEML